MADDPYLYPWERNAGFPHSKPEWTPTMVQGQMGAYIQSRLMNSDAGLTPEIFPTIITPCAGPEGNYSIGMHYSAKGEIISVLPLAMGGVPSAGCDVRANTDSVLLYGISQPLDGNPEIPERLRLGDLLN